MSSAQSKYIVLDDDDDDIDMVQEEKKSEAGSNEVDEFAEVLQTDQEYAPSSQSGSYQSTPPPRSFSAQVQRARSLLHPVPPDNQPKPFNWRDYCEPFLQMQHKKQLDTCTICLHWMPIGCKLVVLPCWHIFHEKCIADWFKNKKKCPNCNERIDGKSN